MNMHEIAEYLAIFRRRWWLFALLVGASAGVIVLTAYLAPAQYEATTKFLVNTPPAAQVALYPTFDSPNQNQQIAATRNAFMEALRNPTVIRAALEQINSPLDPSQVRNNLTIDEPTNSQLVNVTVRAASAAEAAAVANALVEAGRTYFGELQAVPAAQAREFISSQVQGAEQRLAQANAAFIAYKQDNQISDLPSEIQAQRDIITRLSISSSEALVNGEADKAQAYERLIETNEAELLRLTTLSDQYSLLREDMGGARDYYRFLVDKETEAILKENELRRAGFIQVVESAYTAETPVSPLDLRILIIGLVASVIVSAVLALALDYREKHPTNPLQRTDPLTAPAPKAANGD